MTIAYRISTTLNPSWFQGRGKKAPYFEGWYFKLIDRAQEHKLAIIPGMILGKDAHAFIQVLDGNLKTAHYLRYPLSEFSSATDEFKIQVGTNSFSEKGISLNLHEADLAISGKLKFEEQKPWPVGIASPGIMGWYAWVPTMECYHGVGSLDHGLKGSLRIDEKEIEFSGGRGYTEKDWGRSFPSAWIWMQSNHFQTKGTSLTASIAMIPWQFTRFRGFIVGLLWEDRLYRFATYTRARTESLELYGKTVHWTLIGKTQGGKHRLEIRAINTGATDLAGPTTHDMGKRVPESLNSEIEVRLSRLEHGKELELFHEKGSSAGLEIFNVEEELLAKA